MKYWFNIIVIFLIPNPPHGAFLNTQSRRNNRNQITDDITQCRLMADYDNSTLYIGPVSGSKNTLYTSTGTYFIIGYKIRSQCHRGLLSTPRWTGYHQRILRQFQSQPIRHTFCLV